ncbi:hypothetical protein HN51_005423 [Arachis hypogaea]
MAYILAVNTSITVDSGATSDIFDCIFLCFEPTIPLTKYTGPIHRFVQPDPTCKFRQPGLHHVGGFCTKPVKFVPKPVRISSSLGIGLFLAFIGLQNNEGIELIRFNPSTLITLGGCSRSDLTALSPVITSSMELLV